MRVFLILSISANLAFARFLVSESVLKIVHGSIGKMDDLMPPPLSRRAEEPDITYGKHEELPDFQQFLEQIEDFQQWNIKWNSTSSELHIKDLDDASKALTDIKKDLEAVAKDQHLETRRQDEGLELPNEIWGLRQDPVRLREWYYMKLTLTLLIHIRFQVDIAIRQKMATNSYPGYRVGYLFQRLMKTRMQMYRIMEEWNTMKVERLVQNRPNWRTKKRNLQLLLQLYERMLQLDVDAKDTCEMIKLLFYGRPIFQTQMVEPTTPPRNM